MHTSKNRHYLCVCWPLPSWLVFCCLGLGVCLTLALRPCSCLKASQLPPLATFLSALCFCLSCPSPCLTINNRDMPEVGAGSLRPEAGGRRPTAERLRRRAKAEGCYVCENARHVSASGGFWHRIFSLVLGGSVLNAVAGSCTCWRAL